MDIRSEMLSRLKARKPGFSLDPPFYIHEDYCQQDLEHIWYKDWLFIGHDCELPGAGNDMTVQVSTYPVVIVRDNEGGIKAFHNSCRHRGSRVCLDHKGTAAKLVCPDHQWTYDLDGSLLFARQMGENYDTAGYGLKTVASELAGGYIFISLADQPMDFAPFTAMMEPYFLSHRLRDAKIAFESTIIEKGNWKLVWENNRECYHCAGNRPELCKTFPEAPTVTGVNGAKDDPEIAAHWRKCEAAGLPSAIVRAEGFDMGHYHQESFGAASISESLHKQAEDRATKGRAIDLVVSFLGSSEEVVCQPGQTILETARLVGVRIPAACESGICGTCKVLKRSGEVDMRHNGGISDQEVAGGFVLARCTRPLSSVEIEA